MRKILGSLSGIYDAAIYRTIAHQSVRVCLWFGYLHFQLQTVGNVERIS